MWTLSGKKSVATADEVDEDPADEERSPTTVDAESLLKIGGNSVIKPGFADVDDPADQLALFKAIVSENLSVRKIEDRVRGVKKPAVKRLLPLELEQVRQNVSEQLAAVVNIKANKAGKGKLEVDFTSNEDLKRILSILDLWQ